MKKKSKSKTSVDPYLEGLMSKLLDRLVSLEKKMDVVVSRTAGKSNGDANVPAKPRHDRTLYEAICADCHKICEVPFKPSETRPVYCKECFARRKAGGKNNLGGHGMPILTPVSLPPKPVSKLGMARPAIPSAPEPKKQKKKTLKKAKKKK